jgi:hypothetical protein
MTEETQTTTTRLVQRLLCRPTFQFSVINQKRIVGLFRRVPRDLAVRRRRIRALLPQHLVTRIRGVGDGQHRMNGS